MTRCTSEDSVTLDCFRSAGLPFNTWSPFFFLCFFFFGRPLRTENTVFHSTTGVTLHFLSFIYHFHIDHSAPCLLYSPQHFTYPLFPISTGYYIRPKKNQRQSFCKCYFFSFGGWGGWGRGKQGILWSMWKWWIFYFFFSENFASWSPIGPWRFNFLFFI